MNELSASSLRRTLQIPTAEAFQPFLQPARYKGAHGGRGSGKSHFFAGLGVEDCYCQHIRMVCIREVQKDLKESAMQLILDKIEKHGLRSWFNVSQGEIRGPNESMIIFRGMQQYNADSIKSLEGYNRAWIEEAQALSQRSLDLLRPTIRSEGSEIWASWNPTSEFDPIDMFLRGKHPPADAVIKQVNWAENPWFPRVLYEEMLRDRMADAAKAAHIWDGDYQAAPAGAYYAELLAEALHDGRVGGMPVDPALDVHVGFDLGNGPNMTAVMSQWVGRELRLVDCIVGTEEAANIGWPWYIAELKKRRYTYGTIYLPHDARARQRNNGKGDEQTLRDAGFRTDVVSKMDPGERVKLVQRMLPMCWIDAAKCAPALMAWKSYRVNWDDKLRIDRGPLHDWSSHFCDALGHICQAYEAPRLKRKTAHEQPSEGSWMG